VEKYGRVIQATDGNTLECKQFACWINKARNKRLEYKILPGAHGNCGYVNVPHSEVIPVLPLFFDVK
jgi:hypothetical protein